VSEQAGIAVKFPADATPDDMSAIRRTEKAIGQPRLVSKWNEELEGQDNSERFPVSEKRFHLRNKVDKESIGPSRKASDLP
jgi:hypothetical protein